MNLLRDLTVIWLLEYHPALACGFPGDLLVISEFWTWWSQAKSKPENSKNESIDSHITSPLKNCIGFPASCIHHLNSPPFTSLEPQDVLQHQLHPVGSCPGYPLPPARQPLVMATVRPIHRDPTGFAKSLPAFEVCDVSLAWFLMISGWKMVEELQFYWILLRWNPWNDGEIHEIVKDTPRRTRRTKLEICDQRNRQIVAWILAFGTCVVRFRGGLDMGQIDHDWPIGKFTQLPAAQQWRYQTQGEKVPQLPWWICHSHAINAWRINEIVNWWQLIV